MRALPHANRHTVAAGQQVIGVGDQDPRMIELASGTTGEGLRTVVELAAAYDGDVGVEPTAQGKTVLVRFQLPGTQQ